MKLAHGVQNSQLLQIIEEEFDGLDSANLNFWGHHVVANRDFLQTLFSLVAIYRRPTGP